MDPIDGNMSLKFGADISVIDQQDSNMFLNNDTQRDFFGKGAIQPDVMKIPKAMENS